MKVAHRSARHHGLFAVIIAVVVSVWLTGCGGDDSSATPSDGPTSQTSLATGPSADPESGTSSTTLLDTDPPTATPAPSSTAPGAKSLLPKICGSAFDATSKTCRINQKNFVAYTIRCSAQLPSAVTGTVSTTLYRDGSPVYTAQTTRTNDAQPLLLSFSTGRLQVPGGTYDCVYRNGNQSWRGTTTVDGPTGIANQTMACEASTMYRYGASFAHCTKTNATLKAPKTIACSSLLTQVLGKKVDVLLETPIGPAQTSAGVQKQGAAVVHITADASNLGGSIPTGKYSCTFLADGKKLSSVDFTVD